MLGVPSLKTLWERQRLVFMSLLAYSVLVDMCFSVSPSNCRQNMINNREVHSPDNDVPDYVDLPVTGSAEGVHHNISVIGNSIADNKELEKQAINEQTKAPGKVLHTTKTGRHL